MSWIEVVNEILRAHREKDIAAEKYWQDVLDELEPTYADFLDAVDY